MALDSELEPAYIVPNFSLFQFGFTLPKRLYPQYMDHFKLAEGHLVSPIRLIIKAKEYPAKIKVARIRSVDFINRDVVQIIYSSETETLKALRRLFIYSYASTINKSKSSLKELMELDHIGRDAFTVKAVSKQKTDFDGMFNFLEDKNLFEYIKSTKNEGKNENFFVGFSPAWISVDKLDEYRTRNNVIYLLYHSKNKLLYIGKANRLSGRVRKGVGRIGLPDDWDKFMFFEINPNYNAFIEQIEAFVIRTFASLLENDVGMAPLNEKNIKLVNRQLISKKTRSNQPEVGEVSQQETLQSRLEPTQYLSTNGDK